VIFRGRRAAGGAVLRLACAVAPLVALPALVGCQQGGVVTVSTAEAAPSQTSAPDPSDSPGGAAYAMLPRPARAHTYAGAQAFAEFYVMAANKAGDPVEPEVLHAFGMTSCSGCNGYVRAVRRLRAQGERYGAAAARVQPVTGLPDSEPKADLVVMNVVGKALAVPVLSRSGAKVDTTASGRIDLELCLEWDGRRWQISSLQGGVAG
jgi:hypothetical protein